MHKNNRFFPCNTISNPCSRLKFRGLGPALHKNIASAYKYLQTIHIHPYIIELKIHNVKGPKWCGKNARGWGMGKVLTFFSTA